MCEVPELRLANARRWDDREPVGDGCPGTLLLTNMRLLYYPIDDNGGRALGRPGALSIDVGDLQGLEAGPSPVGDVLRFSFPVGVELRACTVGRRRGPWDPDAWVAACRRLVLRADGSSAE